MNILTSGLKKTTEGVGDLASGLGKGLQDVGSSVEHGLKGVGDSLAGSQPRSARDSRTTTSQPTGSSKKDPLPTAKTSDTPKPVSGIFPPSGPGSSSLGGLFGTVSSSASAILTPTADIAKSGATLVRDTAGSGLSIGQNIAQSGLDVGANVAASTADVVKSSATLVQDAAGSGVSIGRNIGDAANTVGDTADTAKSGATIAAGTLGSGFSLAKNIVHSGFDVGAHVVTGTTSITKSGVTLAAGATGSTLSLAKNIAEAGLHVGETVITDTVEVAKSGGTLAVGAAGSTLSLAKNIAETGVDVGANVVTGTASIAKSGATLVVDAAGSGLAIGESVARTGLHVGGTVVTGTADIARSGGSLILDAAGSGIAISQKIAKSGLDMSVNVVTGTASLTGTVLGGVVTAAAHTSGAVFEPISSGLRVIEGLDKLGQGVEAINGLLISAVREVREMTNKALKMVGKRPTFFDPDGDGIVHVSDTVRGLTLLGLREQHATYAALLVHASFSYSTSDRWMPSFDRALPIHVEKMKRTYWGKNWGDFERVSWISDLQISMLFQLKQGLKHYSDYLKLARQGLGALLLLFEWGTTWPFYMPSIPIHQIPLASDIGLVIRNAILPTLFENFKHCKQLKEAEAHSKAASHTQEPSETPSTKGKHS